MEIADPSSPGDATVGRSACFDSGKVLSQIPFLSQTPGEMCVSVWNQSRPLQYGGTDRLNLCFFFSSIIVLISSCFYICKNSSLRGLLELRFGLWILNLELKCICVKYAKWGLFNYAQDWLLFFSLWWIVLDQLTYVVWDKEDMRQRETGDLCECKKF